MLLRLIARTALALPLLLAAPVLAKEPAAKDPAAKEAPAKDGPAKESATKAPSPGQTAARERQKTCGAAWRALTDAQKSAQGPKWPQYWSKCNARLKGGSKA